MSPYELRRQKNIDRNNQRLQALGFSSGSSVEETETIPPYSLEQVTIGGEERLSISVVDTEGVKNVALAIESESVEEDGSEASEKNDNKSETVSDEVLPDDEDDAALYCLPAVELNEEKVEEELTGKKMNFILIFFDNQITLMLTTNFLTYR